MICSICKLNKSTIHIQEIFNDNLIEEKHICKKCAVELNLFEENNLFNIPNLDISKSDIGYPTLNSILEDSNSCKDDIICSSCGMSLSKFLAKKTIGCYSCYDAFQAYIKAYLLSYTLTNSHIGKKPNQDIDSISMFLVLRISHFKLLRMGLIHEPFLRTNLFLSPTYEDFTKIVAFMNVFLSRICS
ncbi:MAG: hypothetical protein ATN35_03450 [Epulopiscium sp. Nele67-Bin004]|nr:MAG: hypothetical protein ATN35_03450 [Epulopiscium sp. Nele67-Bin004]